MNHGSMGEIRGTCGSCGGPLEIDISGLCMQGQLGIGGNNMQNMMSGPERLKCSMCGKKAITENSTNFGPVYRMQT